MIKPIAIHLPQFHPFTENDKWWGKGFTEWTNVTRAKPLFKEHYQPHLPADLGFYDLRLEEARIAQIILAKEYGIYGFCYYHYWFNGKRLMHEPLDRMLKNPKEDFPFMLCWANENWTRRWDGAENEILIKQDYSLSDHKAHSTYLCQTFFKDRRYIRIGNKPVIIFYKAFLIPEIEQALQVWQETAKEQGFEGLYMLCMDNFTSKPAEELGFDAAVHFQPDYRYFKRDLGDLVSRFLHKTGIKKSIRYLHHFEQYQAYVNNSLATTKTISNKVYPGVTPGWDNTARKQKDGIVLHNSTPELFDKWLGSSIEKNKDTDFIFVNAWNEWAEGNHLEPCQKWGRAYLSVLKKHFKNEI